MKKHANLLAAGVLSSALALSLAGCSAPDVPAAPAQSANSAPAAPTKPSVPAASPESTVPEINPADWPAAPIEGLAWGMAREEALSALGLAAADWEESSRDKGVFTLKTPGVRFGADAQSVVLKFSEEDGLIEISMGFAPADCRAVVAALKAVYGQPASDGVPGAANEQYIWNGQSVAQLEAAAQDKLWARIEAKGGADAAERYRAGAGAMLLQQIQFGVGENSLPARLCVFRGAWAAMLRQL